MDLPVMFLGPKQSNCNSRVGIINKQMRFAFTPAPEGVSDIEWIHKGIEYIVDYIKEGSLPSDKFGFTFTSPNFQNYGNIAFGPASDIDLEAIYNVVDGLIQSSREKDSSCMTEKFVVKSTRIRDVELVENYTFDENISLHQNQQNPESFEPSWAVIFS